MWLSVSAGLLTSFTPVASATDAFATSVLACAAKTDREHRLDCYDEAVANFNAKLSKGKRDPEATHAAAGALADSGVARTGAVEAQIRPLASVSAMTSSSQTSTAESQPPAALQDTPAGSEAPPTSAAANQTSSVKTPTNGSATPHHVTAQVTAVDYFPDHVVVHLDNHQIWQQVSESSSRLSLHVGDLVTVDRQMGSYWLSWLSGSKGDTIQVKLRSGD